MKPRLGWLSWSLLSRLGGEGSHKALLSLMQEAEQSQPRLVCVVQALLVLLKRNEALGILRTTIHPIVDLPH